VKKSLKRHKNASRMSARTQKIHYRKGLCRSCNEPISPRSKFFCEKHRIKHNYNQLFINRASYVKRIRNEKLCFTCQKAPHLEDKKICENCYQVVTLNLAKARFIQRQRRLSLKILFINFLLEKGDG
jgi:hypothetical protein